MHSPTRLLLDENSALTVLTLHLILRQVLDSPPGQACSDRLQTATGQACPDRLQTATSSVRDRRLQAATSQPGCRQGRLRYMRAWWLLRLHGSGAKQTKTQKSMCFPQSICLHEAQHISLQRAHVSCLILNADLQKRLVSSFLQDGILMRLCCRTEVLHISHIEL